MSNNEEKLVVFEKYPNAIDANIIKGALEASGIAAGVIGDSTATAILMEPVNVVVFRRDLEDAIKAIYGGEMNYEDYQDEMTRVEFDKRQACNEVFTQLALKLHPELNPDNKRKEVRELFVMAKDALEANNLDALKKMLESLA